MIYGIGTDITSIVRFSHDMERYGKRFLEKIFTPDEIAEGDCRADRGNYFSGRFAAREAFFKALGTGWGRGLSLKEVSVEKDSDGRPRFNLSPRVQAVLGERKITRVHLSITHDAELAQAFVVMEGEEYDKGT